MSYVYWWVCLSISRKDSKNNNWSKLMTIMSHPEMMIGLKAQKKTQSILSYILQWAQHAYWMKRKLQAKKKNQQLKDKKTIALDGTIMSNYEEQHCCNKLEMEFHKQNEFILDIVSGVPLMKLACYWWLWKSWRKNFNCYEQVMVWNCWIHIHDFNYHKPLAMQIVRMVDFMWWLTLCSSV